MQRYVTGNAVTGVRKIGEEKLWGYVMEGRMVLKKWYEALKSSKLFLQGWSNAMYLSRAISMLGRLISVLMCAHLPMRSPSSQGLGAATAIARQWSGAP